MSADNVAEHRIQVLEFALGSERYCVDISYIDEIVDVKDIVVVPNTPPQVEGVMDLRGETTKIINPKVVLDIEDDGEGKRIVVFESDDSDGTIGWLVDEVFEVTRITSDSVDRTVARDTVRGVVQRDHGFVVWANPRAINDL